MKRRLHRIANFFAFNLLFFALYLNFIHRDKSAITAAAGKTTAFGQTVIIDNSNTAKNNNVAVPAPVVANTVTQTDAEPLRLSIN